jgi:hypothetical protein
LPRAKAKALALLAPNPPRWSVRNPPPPMSRAGDFLAGEVLPWFENRKKDLASRPLIREQAFGEPFDPGQAGAAWPL